MQTNRLSVLGTGYSSIIEQPRYSHPFGEPGDRYIEGITYEVNENTKSGLYTEFRFDLITTHQELDQFFQMSASGGYSGASFSLNADASYTRSIKIDTTTILAAVSIRVRTGNGMMGRKGFSKQALKALKADRDYVAFTRNYGDSYVAETINGGLLTGFFRLFASNEEEREAISASISGGSGPWSASFNANMQTRTLRQMKNVHIELYRAGGPGEVPVKQYEDPNKALDDFLALAERFPASVDPVQNGRPVILQYITADFNAGVENSPQNTNLNLIPALNTKRQLVIAMSQQEIARGNLMNALRRPGNFIGAEADWKAALSVVDTNEKALLGTFQALGDKALAYVKPAVPPMKPVISPSLKILDHPNLVYNAYYKDFINEIPLIGSNGTEMGFNPGHYGNLHGLNMRFDPRLDYLDIVYTVHHSDTADATYVNGVPVTPGDNFAGNIECITVGLQGLLANYYDVHVRAYVDDQNYQVGGANTRLGTPGHRGRIESLAVDVRHKKIRLKNKPTITFVNAEYDSVFLYTRATGSHAKIEVTMLKRGETTDLIDVASFGWSVENLEPFPKDFILPVSDPMLRHGKIGVIVFGSTPGQLFSDT